MLDDTYLPAHVHAMLAQEQDPEYLQRMALIQSAMSSVQQEGPQVPPAWMDAYDSELRDLIDSVPME